MKIFRKLSSLVFLSILAFTLFVPIFAQAEIFEYTPLEPSFFGKGAGAKIETGTYFSTLYNVALGAAVVLAVLMIVIAGVEYTAGGISESAKSDAKHRITNALIGLFLALFSFLLLKTINPTLVNTELAPITMTNSSGAGTAGGGTTAPAANANELEKGGYYFIKKNADVWELGGPFSSVADCDSDQLRYRSSAGGEAGVVLCSNQQNGMRWLNTTIYERLGATEGTGGPVGVNRADNPCLYSDTARAIIKTNCTTVALLPEKTISRVRYLSQRAGGGIIITGGTEAYGHQTHGPRNNIVDLRETPQLKSFLEDALGKPFTGCRESVTLTGNVAGTYYWEPIGCANSTGNHWHVTF